MNTSIKAKFRPSTVQGAEGTVYYQIICDRKARKLITDYRLFPEEWDSRHSCVRLVAGTARTSLLMSIREKIRCDIRRLSSIVEKLEDTGFSYTADDVIKEFRRYSKEYSLFNYMANVIVGLKKSGRIGTAQNYHHTLNSFRIFRENEDIMLDNIAPDLMASYETWLSERGVSSNTASFYLRILRAVYNRAVYQGIIADRTPFRGVYTGIGKTVKRALPVTVIKRIRTLDLVEFPKLDYARDMFILSFYLRGMSFVDMAFLRKTDLQNGHVSYCRRKTNQRLTVAWVEQMQSILDKYPVNKSDYLLPIIRNKGLNERCAYKNAEYAVNRELKKIEAMLGLGFPLTMYVARHSWASAAKVKGIPLQVISEAMGHESETTTQIYLASLDSSVIDNANSLIIDDLS